MSSWLLSIGSSPISKAKNHLSDLFSFPRPPQTNAKCKRFILDTLLVDRDTFVTVCDGDSLDLGGKTLSFHLTPWVHWPDTMITFAVEDRVLFTCDFLGAHFATTELFARDEAQVAISAKR